ncbi:MAG: hypothetical protein JNL36_06575 [Candidatus Kapabacteria bacterium]|nr:hypothetical protein [Candidatus Kapabacteria bacterium]
MDNDEKNIEKRLGDNKFGIPEKDYRKLIRGIMESAIHTWFKAGIITIEDFKNPHELFKKIGQINNDSKINIVVTHTDDLLLSAREFREESRKNNAKLFYAIFFEHLINGFIDEVCNRKSIDKKAINDIIKSLKMEAKITWLLTLLELPPITSHHKKTLLKLNEDRNSYVHYKYNPEPDEFDKNKDLKIEEEFRQIEKTVTYFKKYVSKLLYNNSKTQIDKHLKKLLKY